MVDDIVKGLLVYDLLAALGYIAGLLLFVLFILGAKFMAKGIRDMQKRMWGTDQEEEEEEEKAALKQPFLLEFFRVQAIGRDNIADFIS